MNAGEFDIIDAISRKFPSLDSSDDAAFIPLENGSTMVLTCDELVEDVHFKRHWLTCENIGHKAVASAISDIAASGAIPRFILTALSIPNSYEKSDIEAIYDGISKYLSEHNIDLVGGNVTSSLNGLSITTTAIGYAEFPIHRKYAFVNDIICVTGELGRPALFLNETLENNTPIKNIPDFIKEKFVSPNAQLFAGQVIGNSGLVHAMCDISDGFLADLDNILKSSNKGAIVNIDKLPISKNTIDYAQNKNLNPYHIAASSGEEYELIFTMSEENYEELYSQLECDITIVGRIINQDFQIFENEKQINLKNLGFKHF